MTLAIALAILGYVSVVATLANTMSRTRIEQAHALAPWDGRITALLAHKLADVRANATERQRSDELARKALRQDATAVRATVAIGVNALYRGDARAARRMFSYSETLSRRDLQTQLWAIEDAVDRGDVPSALKYYDIALRTSPQAADLLFPVLASAISDQTVRAAAIKTLSAQPIWWPSFVDYVAGNGPDPNAAARLLMALRRAGLQVPEGANRAVIHGLITHDMLDQAWSYYASVRPGVDRRMSRDPHFTANVASPSFFDWMPVNDVSVTTSIGRGSTAGIFDFSVPSNIGGPLLQQVQLLPAGDYLFEGHSFGIEQPGRANPYWVLSCRDGRELGRVVVPNSTEARGVFRGKFRIPAGCPLQTLSLIALPSDNMSGVSGQIDQAKIYPAP